MNGLIILTKHHPAALAAIKKLTDNVKARFYPEDMLELTGPVAVTYALKESNMVPQPYRCELKYRNYEYQNKIQGVQEVWVSDLKFDRKRNCYLNSTAGHTNECLVTSSSKREGFQNLMENPLEFTNLAVRALRKDEKNGDVWWHMKTCKGCNDYGDLYRKRQVYCDDPSLASLFSQRNPLEVLKMLFYYFWAPPEPCNISDVYSEDPLAG